MKFLVLSGSIVLFSFPQSIFSFTKIATISYNNDYLELRLYNSDEDYLPIDDMVDLLSHKEHAMDENEEYMDPFALIRRFDSKGNGHFLIFAFLKKMNKCVGWMDIEKQKNNVEFKILDLVFRNINIAIELVNSVFFSPHFLIDPITQIHLSMEYGSSDDSTAKMAESLGFLESVEWEDSQQIISFYSPRIKYYHIAKLHRKICVLTRKVKHLLDKIRANPLSKDVTVYKNVKEYLNDLIAEFEAIRSFYRGNIDEFVVINFKAINEKILDCSAVLNMLNQIFFPREFSPKILISEFSECGEEMETQPSIVKFLGQAPECTLM